MSVDQETLGAGRKRLIQVFRYLEALNQDTSPERKAEIKKQLLAYCDLDTFAMVRLWQFLVGRTELHTLK